MSLYVARLWVRSCFEVEEDIREEEKRNDSKCSEIKAF